MLLKVIVKRKQAQYLVQDINKHGELINTNLLLQQIVLAKLLILTVQLLIVIQQLFPQPTQLVTTAIGEQVEQHL